MKVAIASGKGGTGKTMLSTNLASVMADRGPVQYLDCDVEEPNGHLFLRPDLGAPDRIAVRTPSVDPDLCAHCGACSDLCAFGAIASMPASTVVFPELCHSCGGCALVCPSGAISWEKREIGVVEEGRSGAVRFVHGRLRVGEPMSPALIKAVASHADSAHTVLFDAPPGTSCAVVTTLRSCDLALLVTEPTPFGLHDLELAVEMAREIGIPIAVVVNQDGIGDDRVDAYCAEQGLEVWARIPHDRRIAEAYAAGSLVVRAITEYRPTFEHLAEQIDGRHRRCPND